MTALRVIGVILLLLFLLGLVRVGGIATYSAKEWRVWLKTGFFRFQMFPGRPKKAKKSPETQQTAAASPPPQPGAGSQEQRDPFHWAKGYLPLVCEAAGELVHRIRIDDLELDFRAGAREAATAAMTMGYANMALGIFWPLIDQNFEVKAHRIRTGVDFDADSPTIYGKAVFSARIGQWVSFLLRFGIKFCKQYFRQKQEQKFRLRAEKMTKEANI